MEDTHIVDAILRGIGLTAAAAAIMLPLLVLGQWAGELAVKVWKWVTR